MPKDPSKLVLELGSDPLCLVLCPTFTKELVYRIHTSWFRKAPGSNLYASCTVRASLERGKKVGEIGYLL